MNPPSGEAVAAAPPNNSMSSAAARRQMRHQLVQEHIAKITNQEETDRAEIPQVKREPPKKSNSSFPTADTGRVQVVEARGQRTCRIVVDTPAGHSAGRIKIVMGFERIEQKAVVPKAPTRTAALQPVSATVVPLTTPTIREAPVFEQEETYQDIGQQSAVKMKKPQQGIPSVASESLQKSTIKAAPVMEANAKPDTNVTGPPQKHSTIPQKIVDRKPAAATHTKRVSIKQTPETIKPAAVETRSLAAHAASQQKTTTIAKPKAPPTSKKSKVPPSYQKAKPKVPPSHRGKAKVPPSQQRASLLGISESQRVTAKRNNLASQHLSSKPPQKTKQTKDNTSLDGNSHATPLDKVESREAKQPENQKKLYHGRRKYAVEDLQRMFDDNKLKGPSLQDAKEETLPKNGVSKEKKKKQKKILRAFRV